MERLDPLNKFIIVWVDDENNDDLMIVCDTDRKLFDSEDEALEHLRTDLTDNENCYIAKITGFVQFEPILMTTEADEAK